MADTLTLMAVHAHPDDESSGTGGVLAMYSDEGIRTVVVTCTNGEFGDAPGKIKPGADGHDPDEVAGALRQLQDAISLNTFLVGIIKAPVFALIIGLVGCYEGLQVERNAASVGRLTTRSVVESVFLVIVLDAAFSIIFSIIGI